MANKTHAIDKIMDIVDCHYGGNKPTFRELERILNIILKRKDDELYDLGLELSSFIKDIRSYIKDNPKECIVTSLYDIFQLTTPDEYLSLGSLTELISSIIGHEDIDVVDVFEPCCNTGAISGKIKKKFGCNTYGIEISKNASMLGRHNIDNMINGDIFKDNIYESKKFDVIISNPPFNLTYDKNNYDLDKFEWTKLSNDTSDDFFIMSTLNNMHRDSLSVNITFPGILHRLSDLNLRKYLVDNGLIDTIIVTTNKMYRKTPVPLVLIIIKKNKENKDIKLIDARDEFVRAGRDRKELSDKNIENIISYYISNKAIANKMTILTYDDVVKNNYNLSLNTYFTREKQEQMSMDDIAIELGGLERRIFKMKEALKNNPLYGQMKKEN